MNAGEEDCKKIVENDIKINIKIILMCSLNTVQYSKTGDDVMKLFSNLHKQGQTIILITHEIEVANQAERMEMLYAIKYIDYIHIYTYENELVQLLKNIRPEIRFLGDDYRGKT